MDNFKVGEKVYFLAPLTFDDYDSFCLWAQYSQWEDFQQMAEKLPPEVFKAESDALLKEAVKHPPIKIGSAAMSEAMQDPKGVCYLAYLSLRKNQPQITPKAVRELLTIQRGQEVLRKINILSGLASEETEAQDAPKKRGADVENPTST